MEECVSAELPENLSREELRQQQKVRLEALLQAILPDNRFYARKLHETGLTADALTNIELLPFTTKAELLEDQREHPPYGSVLTYPREKYTRYHQTSGTKGLPLRWLDTNDSWGSVLDVWEALLRIVGVTAEDVLFFPFSFGPFLGFWSAFEAACRLGCLCLSGGGMSSTARLRFLLDNQPTVVLCTPTYALHLLHVASNEGIDLSSSSVRMLIVAGEPGGSVPEVRARIEAGWGARVFDHNGMTETGPVGIECPEQPGGLHVLETHHLVEVIDPATGQPLDGSVAYASGSDAGPPREGELVLTTLARWASPLIRYRTGDLVQVDSHPCPCGRSLIRLQGGIRGRVDDMLVVRGNNVHPSTLQAILHRFPEVTEFRVEVDETGTLPVLRIDVEPTPSTDASTLPARIGRVIQDELLFRAEIQTVPPGSLPRFELKARRVVRKTIADCGLRIADSQKKEERPP
jgi:phenylacetate-CoA ligase